MASWKVATRPRRVWFLLLLGLEVVWVTQHAAFLSGGPPLGTRIAARSTLRAKGGASEAIIPAPPKPEGGAASPSGGDEAVPSEEESSDVFDFGGALGSVVVTIAVFPYAPLTLYSAFILLTTGKGIPPGPNGIFGLAEGFAILTVISVTIWWFYSLVSGSRVLPRGPLGIWDLTQKLCTFCSAIFLGAVAINTYEPDNPFRGLSFTSPTNQWQAAATKATTKVIAATEGPRKQINGVLQEAGKNAADAAGKASKPVADAADNAVKSVTESASKAASTITTDLNRMYKAPKSKTAEPETPKAKPAEAEAPKAKPAEAEAPKAKPAEAEAAKAKPAEAKAPQAPTAEAQAPKTTTAEVPAQAPAPTASSAQVLETAAVSKAAPASVA